MTPDTPQTRWGFPATRWSLVRRARTGDAREAEAALEDLCRAYWTPLYAYARGRGLPRAEAEDRVQEFFAVALRREVFQRADEDAGKLRSFLLTALKHHLQDAAARAGAARRRPEGGWVALDFSSAEADWNRLADAGATPDAAFEREWARALLAQALARLEARYAAEGQAALFAALRDRALGADDAPAGETGAAGLSPGATRVAAHRLRKRFRECLRDAVRDTLPEGGDIDAELRALRAALEAEGA